MRDAQADAGGGNAGVGGGMADCNRRIRPVVNLADLGIGLQTGHRRMAQIHRRQPPLKGVVQHGGKHAAA